MLAMGRALMSKPQLLLLDEPSMGLAPLMVEKVFETDACGFGRRRDDLVDRAECEAGARSQPSRLCDGSPEKNHPPKARRDRFCTNRKVFVLHT
jgi:hypothetical protein